MTHVRFKQLIFIFALEERQCIPCMAVCHWTFLTDIFLSLYNSIVTLETCFNLINFLIDIKTFPEYNYANNLISFGNERQDNIARWRWYIMQSTSRFLKCVIATVSEYVYALTKLLNIIDA